MINEREKPSSRLFFSRPKILFFFGRTIAYSQNLFVVNQNNSRAS